MTVPVSRKLPPGPMPVPWGASIEIRLYPTNLLTVGLVVDQGPTRLTVRCAYRDTDGSIKEQYVFADTCRILAEPFSHLPPREPA